MSNFQVQSNLSCAGATTCNVAGFSAIPAGSFVLGFIIRDGDNHAVPSAGSSGAGTWIVPSGCTTQANCGSAASAVNSGGIEYILSSTGTPTTVTCTSTLNIDECVVVTFTFTGASIAFDVGVGGAGCNSCATGPDKAGVSPGTLTGTNDYIVQYEVTSGSLTGCPNSATSPANFPNGNGICGLLNSTNTTAGTWTDSSSNTNNSQGALAFKEAVAATGTNLRALMGVGK
jgi:hypothetical protein